MQQRKGDLWLSHAEALCITTNGIRRKDESAVMGAGLAKQAAVRYPGLDRTLGEKLNSGNNVYLLHQPFNEPYPEEARALISLPTKEHWRQPTPIELVEKSLLQLVQLIDQLNYSEVALPRPGCGLGGLSWNEQARPLCERILDDRFTIYS